MDSELGNMGQHATVRMSNPGPMPRDHIIWSICSFIYCNPFCLGLIALYYSVKSRDRKLTGDVESAKGYGAKARCLNIAALTLVILTFVIFFSTVSVMFRLLMNMLKSKN